MHIWCPKWVDAWILQSVLLVVSDRRADRLQAEVDRASVRIEFDRVVGGQLGVMARCGGMIGPVVRTSRPT